MRTTLYDTQRLFIPTNFSAQLVLAIKVLRPELLIKSPFLCRMIVFNTESGKCQRPTSSVMPRVSLWRKLDSASLLMVKKLDPETVLRFQLRAAGEFRMTRGGV